MTALSLPTPSATHLLSMSTPIGSIATAIDPGSDFPTEGAVSATHPVEYFSVTLSESALVVLRMQEANTASRCALFLSCATARPNANSASWRLISPEPVKQLVLHPADPAYHVGVLTIAVHYLETSGQSSFQLRAQVRRNFFAMWLRTGKVSRDATAVTGDALSSNAGHNEAGVSKTMRSTLHGVLANAANAPATSLSAPSSAFSSAAFSTFAVPPAASSGALFTSLYIGDWHGNHREGLGFQYYAAPDDVAAGCDWYSVVQAEDSETDAFANHGADGRDAADGPHRPSVSSSHSLQRPSTRSQAAGAAATTTAGGSLANPLLLLRAFSERHNLPWSAWSIPETLTPEELAKLGFGHSFRLAGQGRLAATPNGLEEKATVTASPQSSFDSSLSKLLLTPPSPAAPCATAMEGLSVLGNAIESFLLAEVRDTELGKWAVLPVQPGVEVYAGEWVANRKEGRGVYQWLDRSYIGEWVAGRREGFGLLRRKDRGWYRGQWEHHVPHGTGEARLMPEDMLYKGEWRDGRRSGRGCLTYPDGTVVHGIWVADALQPDVHIVYADGSTYDGVWGPDACREGHGTLTDTEGCRHIHNWSHNTRVGEGKEVYPNGVVLEGTWRDDVPTNAVYVFPNGDRYVGDMDATRHVREGVGTCTSADGLSSYTGGWSHDQRTGHGTFVRHKKRSAPASAGGSVDGVGVSGVGAAAAAAEDPEAEVVERYDGEWLDDMRSGAGHEENSEEVYDGSFALDRRDGLGTQRNTRTGSLYNGSWKAGCRCGAGSYYSATKDTTYEGVFLHDRLTGSGTATKGGSLEQFSGLWLDGMEQGHGSLRLANGDTLRGVWHRGRPRPDANVEYTDAPERDAICDSRYVGGWRDGVRHGVGTQVFRDGSVYEGAWENNEQHGHGRRTAVSGESVECDWVRGGIAPNCVATVRFADGSVYTGRVNVAGVPHGAGVLAYPDGTVFQGRFTDGIYQL